MQDYNFTLGMRYALKGYFDTALTFFQKSQEEVKSVFGAFYIEKIFKSNIDNDKISDLLNNLRRLYNKVLKEYKGSDPDIFFIIGELYQGGFIYDNKDYVSAAIYFDKATKLGSYDALISLEGLYRSLKYLIKKDNASLDERKKITIDKADQLKQQILNEEYERLSKNDIFATSNIVEMLERYNTNYSEEEKYNLLNKNFPELLDSKGLLELAKCYLYGLGTKQDIKKAYEIYLTISRLNFDSKISPIEKYILSEPKKSEIDLLEINKLLPNIFAIYMLADLHFDNFIKIDANLNYEDLFEEQKKLAGEYLHKAYLYHLKMINDNSPKLDFHYSEIAKIIDSNLVKDIKEDSDYYKKMAFEDVKRKSVNSILYAYELSLLYLNGYGTPSILKEAKKTLRSVLDKFKKGLSFNSVGLRVISTYAKILNKEKREGKNDKKDDKEFRNLVINLKNMADHNNELANSFLGELYYKGDEIENESNSYFSRGKSNFPMAFKHYLAAADMDDPNSQYMVGKMYENGTGVNKDTSKAVDYYLKAAKNQETKAIARLAEIYDEGIIVKRSSEDSLKWIKFGTQLKDGKSWFKLGQFHSKGNKERKPDLKLTKIYYERAIYYGYDASRALDGVLVNLGLKSPLHSTVEQFIEKIDLSKPNDFDKYISEDLERIFDSKLSMLKPETVTTIKTGLLIYLTLYNIKDVDFAPVIVEIVKGFEIELKEYFIKGYLEYLKTNEIDPEYALGELNPESSPLILKYGNKLTYKNYSEINFTLGMIPNIIGKENINKAFLEYCHNQLFIKNKNDDWIDINTKYLLELSQDIEELSFNYRNNAAHSKIMSKKEASEVINIVVKGERRIFNLINRINYDNTSKA
jgi:TPR repeat protein